MLKLYDGLKRNQYLILVIKLQRLLLESKTNEFKKIRITIRKYSVVEITIQHLTSNSRQKLSRFKEDFS